MIEVMIAITVLAVAITAILGNYQTLDSSRRDTASRGAIAELARGILDRIVAADAQSLGNETTPPGAVAQPWSLARIEDDPALRPPLTQNAPNEEDDLVALGLIPGPVPVEDIQVWIEYYRGLDVLDPSSGDVISRGVLSETFDEREDFREFFRNPTWRQDRRLATNITPILQVDEDDPIVIRLILIWEGGQRLEFYTIKRRSPGG